MDNLRATSIGADGGTTQPTRMEGLLDVNLLPERYQRARLRWSSVLAWLALLALIVLLARSYQQWQRASARVNASRLAFSAAQAEMEAIDPNAEARAKLLEQIDAARSRAADLRSAAAAISIQDVQWGNTIASIRAAQVEGLRLTDISEDGGTLHLAGDARSYPLPLDYASALRSTGEYPEVVVESISKVELAPDQQTSLAEGVGDAGDGEGALVLNPGEPVIRYAFEISVVVQVPVAPTGEVPNESQ